MGKVTHPKSFRLTTQALARLNAYCDLSGLDASEVARAAIAQFIAPALQGVSIDTTEPPKVESSDSGATQVWFKAFWGVCGNKQFPKRVVKTIKDNWDDLKEFDAEELGTQYNRYCEKEEMESRFPCHPNSWLANGGYENEDKKQDSGIAWDAE